MKNLKAVVTNYEKTGLVPRGYFYPEILVNKHRAKEWKDFTDRKMRLPENV